MDGYNLPLAIVVLAANSGDSAILDIPPNLTNPACIGTAALLASEQYNPYLSSTTSFLGTNSSFPLPFEGTQTFQQILRWCPWDLQLQPPLRPADGVYPYPDDTVQRPSFGPCYSACAKYNRPSDCCTQEYNSPEVCRPSMYSRSAKAICPDAYSYGRVVPSPVLGRLSCMLTFFPCPKPMMTQHQHSSSLPEQASRWFSARVAGPPISSRPCQLSCAGILRSDTWLVGLPHRMAARSPIKTEARLGTSPHAIVSGL